jgi:uncharacterized protein
MRVNVQGLPMEQDFPTQFEIAPEKFKSEKSLHPETDPIIIEPVYCDATLRRMPGDEVFLQIEAHTHLENICDRCTKLYQEALEVQIQILCRPLTQRPYEQEEEDEGLIYFTKSQLDLDEIVREQILLELPIQHLCDANCQGLCTRCGENLNENAGHTCDTPQFMEYKAKVL